jgi:hypothetical protein
VPADPPSDARGLADGVSAQLTLFPLPRALYDPHCLDCDVDTVAIGHFYMLRRHAWLEANPDDAGMLCFRCVQARLGRRLTAHDFMDLPINRKHLSVWEAQVA